MAPFETHLEEDDVRVPPMPTVGVPATRSKAWMEIKKIPPPPARTWARCGDLLLVVAIISSLQYPVQSLEDSSTQPVNISASDSPVWPSQGVTSSSTANGPSLRGGEFLINATLYYILSALPTTNGRTSDNSQTSNGKENLTMLEEYLSSLDSSSQPTDKTDSTSGLRDTNMFSTILPSPSLTSTHSNPSYPSTVHKETFQIDNLSQLPTSSITSSPSSSFSTKFLSSATSPAPVPSSISAAKLYSDTEASSIVPYWDGLTFNGTLGINEGNTDKHYTDTSTDANLNATNNLLVMLTISSLKKSETHTSPLNTNSEPTMGTVLEETHGTLIAKDIENKTTMSSLTFKDDSTTSKHENSNTQTLPSTSSEVSVTIKLLSISSDTEKTFETEKTETGPLSTTESYDSTSRSFNENTTLSRIMSSLLTITAHDTRSSLLSGATQPYNTMKTEHYSAENLNNAVTTPKITDETSGTETSDQPANVTLVKSSVPFQKTTTESTSTRAQLALTSKDTLSKAPTSQAPNTYISSTGNNTFTEIPLLPIQEPFTATSSDSKHTSFIGEVKTTLTSQPSDHFRTLQSLASTYVSSQPSPASFDIDTGSSTIIQKTVSKPTLATEEININHLSPSSYAVRTSTIDSTSPISRLASSIVVEDTSTLHISAQSQTATTGAISTGPFLSQQNSTVTNDSDLKTEFLHRASATSSLQSTTILTSSPSGQSKKIETATSKLQTDLPLASITTSRFQFSASSEDSVTFRTTNEENLRTSTHSTTEFLTTLKKSTTGIDFNLYPTTSKSTITSKPPLLTEATHGHTSYLSTEKTTEIFVDKNALSPVVVSSTLRSTSLSPEPLHTINSSPREMQNSTTIAGRLETKDRYSTNSPTSITKSDLSSPTFVSNQTEEKPTQDHNTVFTNSTSHFFTNPDIHITSQPLSSTRGQTTHHYIASPSITTEGHQTENHTTPTRTERHISDLSSAFSEPTYDQPQHVPTTSSHLDSQLSSVFATTSNLTHPISSEVSSVEPSTSDTLSATEISHSLNPTTIRSTESQFNEFNSSLSQPTPDHTPTQKLSATAKETTQSFSEMTSKVSFSANSDVNSVEPSTGPSVTGTETYLTEDQSSVPGTDRSTNQFPYSLFQTTSNQTQHTTSSSSTSETHFPLVSLSTSNVSSSTINETSSSTALEMPNTERPPSENQTSLGSTETVVNNLTSLSQTTSEDPQRSQYTFSTTDSLKTEISSIKPITLSSLTDTEKSQPINQTSLGSTERSLTEFTSLLTQTISAQHLTTPKSPMDSHQTSVSMTISSSSDYTRSEIITDVPTTTKVLSNASVSTDLHSSSDTKGYLVNTTSSIPVTHTITSTEMREFNQSTSHSGVTASSAFHTPTHLSTTSPIPTHPSTMLQTTETIPTSVFNSLFTVSSSLTTSELPALSPTENSTQSLSPSSKMPTSPSSETHTVPSTHKTSLTLTTLLSTTRTKPTTQSQTLSFVNETTSITPTSVYIPPVSTIVSRTSLMSPIPSTHVPSSSTVSSATVSPVKTTNPGTTNQPSVTPTSPSTSTSMPTTTVTSVKTTPNTTTVHSTSLITEVTTVVTTPSPLECKLSPYTMIKTVLTLTQQLTGTENDNFVKNFSDAITQTLYQVLNKPIEVRVNRTALNMDSQTPINVTVGYSILVNSSVYIPSAIVDILTANPSILLANLRHHIPKFHAVPVQAVPWEPVPDYIYQLKTVLKLMSTIGNIHSCSYVQGMEDKLKVAFEKAAITNGAKNGNLSVQILSTSQTNQILTMIYVVRNGSQLLNGTVSSKLLNVLIGQVVGYYLGDPPLIIAEPLFYPSIDTSESTINSWVITVILGVEETLLGINNKSFARLMEERLAKLFQVSGQQARRFKRETTVGRYTVQMVRMQRGSGSNNPADLIYYALKDGFPLLGNAAAKQLSTIDPQNMALTLGYIVRTQAEPVIKNPPNNLWIIAAVLAPIAVVTVIIIIITAVLCRKNKSDFKAENISNMPPRTKPVQGFDYAKQHLGQQGGDEDVLPVTQETVVPSLNLSQERDSTQDGSTEKMLKSSDTRKSRSPCENGSVISNESEDASSDRSTPQKVMAQHRVTKDDACKRNGFKKTRKIVPISDEEEGNIRFDKNTKMVPDPFDSSSGSVQLVAIKPVPLPPSHPALDRNQDMAGINGEVNKALKQKSDIEHYRNKLRLKAKRKGYYDFPPLESKSLTDRKRKAFEKTQMEIDNVLDADTDTSSPFAEPKHRQPSIKNHPYRSRQSLNSPSPGETEMDLLVTRERPRRGIRNSGYDTEPEIIEETNIDRVKQARTFIKSRQAKGHSETSTLSSQPSIDEVRQQMHMLLEEAFSLASAGHGRPKRQPDTYASVQHMPYSDVVTSAPGTMSRPRMQWVPTYGPEMYQYSLPRPTYRFSHLPEMVVGSPPPPVPPRTGPVAVPSLKRSTSDVANKTRMPEPSGNEQGPGNSVPAVFAIPGNRSGYSGYFVPQPPTTYRNQAWMSYPGENELPGQWADSVPLPGYIEAYPRPRYPQNSPSRLPRQFSQPVNIHSNLDHAAGPSIGASQQSLADTDTPDASITNLSTAALVKAIREEVAKLAKKQTDMFEFQV
uniref:KIAA1549 like n=1 Tax=Leptobrachium leishanense TaxID=445787 RepID=A0A8C5QWR7_9ANUR